MTDGQTSKTRNAAYYDGRITLVSGLSVNSISSICCGLVVQLVVCSVL